MKAERLYESQGGPIILSQVAGMFPVHSIFLTIVQFVGQKVCFFGPNSLNCLINWWKFLSFLITCLTDWEWVWANWEETGWTRQILLRLGSKNGIGSWYWCTLGHVQARWCSRSYCMFLPIYHQPIYFALSWILLSFYIIQHQELIKYINSCTWGVFCSQNPVCSPVFSAYFNHICHYLDHRLETMLICLFMKF